jgi:5-methyltetrahydrofolate--homocysteine methyltransferase
MSTLISRLEARKVLVADGATGTMLQRAGLEPGVAPERWNLENPEAILELHQGYVNAGSDLILTNTFGGTSIRLKREGLNDQAAAINQTAARLAREVAGESVLVVGDMGPTGEMLAPLGTLTYEDIVPVFAEQAQALAEGGVDGILIETMSDLNEMKAAIEGARRVTDLPLLTTMSFDTKGRTMMGVKPEDAAAMLAELDVTVMGVNCGRTLTENLTAIQAFREAVPDAWLMAKPNAGLPRTEKGELVYDVTPEVMAEYAQRFVNEVGVKIFGGCCGSTPAHIRAVVEAVT